LKETGNAILLVNLEQLVISYATGRNTITTFTWEKPLGRICSNETSTNPMTQKFHSKGYNEEKYILMHSKKYA
jgi:hypothetical protein